MARLSSSLGSLWGRALASSLVVWRDVRGLIRCRREKVRGLSSGICDAVFSPVLDAGAFSICLFDDGAGA
jgi:hypothetical protein